MTRLASMPRSIASLVRARHGARPSCGGAGRVVAVAWTCVGKGIPRFGVRVPRNGPFRDALRLLVAAFGDAGHAFPAIALARALGGAATRSLVETWERWRERGRGRGTRVHGGGGVHDLPTPAGRTRRTGDAAAAAAALLPLMEEFRPDVVVSDILTLAPTLAAERAGVPARDADPARVSGAASRGCRSSRSGCGRRGRRSGGAAWRGAPARAREGIAARARRAERDAGGLGLAPVERLSRRDQRASWRWWRRSRSWSIRGGGRRDVHVTGPMEFELPYADDRAAGGRGAAGAGRAEHAQDPELRLVRAALEALAEEPVRVVATTNRHRPERPVGRRRTRWWSTGSPTRR